MRTLLLGLGNPILTDDGIGVRLARDLRARLPAIPGLDFQEECSLGGLNLLEVITGYDRVILLDAMQTGQAPPGDWTTFDARTLRATQHLSSIHDLNFATALELGRRLGHALPADEEIRIWAVEVRELTTFCEEFSPALAAAYPALRDAILGEVAALLEE